MPVSEDKLSRAIDCNGFPMKVGDLVEMTELLDARHRGYQGVVVDVNKPNICLVQMEKQILNDSGRPEVVAAAGFLWKLRAQGVEG